MSTFVLIFLAELGDKTQLAAMASSAGSKAPWSVFIGAASALVLSTLLAVMLGKGIARVAPQHIIKGIAGGVFILFGIIFIVSALQMARARRVAAAELKPGVLSHIALEMAARFEEASVQDYADLAERAAAPELKSLFERLAEEEAGHLKHLHEMLHEHAEVVHEGEHALPEVPSPEAVSGVDSKDILKTAVAHEQSMIDFYRALSESTHFPSLKALFSRLADGEEKHLRYLQEFA
jgi:rubrerythrin